MTWVIHLIGSNKLFLFNYMIKKEVTTLNESNFYKKNNHNDLHKKKNFPKGKKTQSLVL
jgi:hypothetical protein